MSDTNILWRSFAGGEIAPELYGRMDLTKFQTGLALCKNFRVLPHGPVVNRAGFEYVLEVKDSSRRTRLIPFRVSSSDTLIIELGHNYMRFHSNGQTVVEAAQNITAITKADPGVVTIAGHGYSNGEWVYLSGIGGMTELNGRFVKVASATTDTFAIEDLAGEDIDTSDFTTYTSGGTASRVFEVETNYEEEDLFEIIHTQATTRMTLTHASYEIGELVRNTLTDWDLGTIDINPPIAAPTNLTWLEGTGPGSDASASVPRDYVVTALVEEGFQESYASEIVTTDPICFDHNVVFVGWDAVADAIRYNIYRRDNAGGAFGYIGQAEGTNFCDDAFQPDTAIQPPETPDLFGAAGDYPAAVSYFEQRRVFAGSDNEPQTLWMSRPGTDSNFTKSLPTQDDDSISFRISSREGNRILHIVPLEDLILLSSSGTWRVYTQNSDFVTPTTISVKPQAYVGASQVPPLVVGNSILYGAALGGHVIELKYDAQITNGYGVNDLSIMAPHLFDSYTLVQFAYAGAPYKTAWAVRSDGVLLGMTYVPEHEVFAWHQHNTDGEFESVACVEEGNEDATYVIVKRTINGRTVRYIERMRSQQFGSLEDAFFVDAGETYDGTPVTELTGLYHLEGETVNVLADGAVHPPLTVENGAITLEHAASVVHVGLPITADVETLPPSIETQGFGLGMTKNVTKVHMRLKSASGVQVGPSFDKLRPFKQRTSEPYGSPPALVTGVHSVVIDGTWTMEGTICLRQTDPLPVTILALGLETAVGG